MNEYPLQSFIDLVAFDQGTLALEDEIQQIQKDIEMLERKQAELTQALEHEKAVMHNARKEVDSAELEMKELEQQEQEEKKRLDMTSNQKEYQAIQKEIAALKKKQHDYEETLLFAWNTFESAKKAYEEHHVQYEQKIAELNTSVEEKKSKKETLQKDLDIRYSQREQKTKTIPPEWLEKYILMRSRVEDPVVPVVSGSCSACFYHLPPQDFLELRRRKMLQCKGCYRFLYVEQAQQESEQPEEQQEQESTESAEQ